MSVPSLRDVPLVVGENISANQLECLALMGFDRSRILRLRKGRLARFRMLWAPTMPLCGLSGNNALLWAPNAIRFFRQKLNIERAQSGEKRRRLFISRKGAKWRRLLNEEELVRYIEKSGFEIVDPGVLSIAEQISIAASAEAIMGQIGAGMNMILFAPPGTAVIQLVAHSSVVMNLTEPVAMYLKQKYFEIDCSPVLNEGVKPLDADSIVSVAHVQRALHLFGLSERAPCSL
jgi:capsular polysaccharide biosynthesis protein